MEGELPRPSQSTAPAPGFCHGSRATRATDSVNEERFPYEPSKEEKSTFEYVLFPREGRSTFAALLKAVPGFIRVILVFVNIMAIASNVYNAPVWSDDGNVVCGVHSDRNDTLVTIAVLTEAGLLLGLCLLPAAYFMVRLCCLGEERGLTGECCWDIVGRASGLGLTAWSYQLSRPSSRALTCS